MKILCTLPSTPPFENGKKGKEKKKKRKEIGEEKVDRRVSVGNKEEILDREWYRLTQIEI